jgi:hypothetical protein
MAQQKPWKMDFDSVEGLKHNNRLDPPGFDSNIARDWVRTGCRGSAMLVDGYSAACAEHASMQCMVLHCSVTAAGNSSRRAGKWCERAVVDEGCCLCCAGCRHKHTGQTQGPAANREEAAGAGRTCSNNTQLKHCNCKLTKLLPQHKWK